MRPLLLISLALLCATSAAQVFKRVGPDGQVHFSDIPGSDAQEIEVAPAQVISLPPAPARTDSTAAGTSDGQPVATSLYTDFAIVSPSDGEAIRANDGNIEVSLRLQPELRPGHRIVLKLDGEDGELVESGERLNIRLTNLSRGLHSVEARVIGDKDRILVETGPVSFNVLRVAAGGGS